MIEVVFQDSETTGTSTMGWSRKETKEVESNHRASAVACSFPFTDFKSLRRRILPLSLHL